MQAATALIVKKSCVKNRSPESAKQQTEKRFLSFCPPLFYLSPAWSYVSGRLKHSFKDVKGYLQHGRKHASASRKQPFFGLLSLIQAARK
jgi:hypothetical protein